MSSPDMKNTHSLTSSAASGGLSTTKLKTISKEENSSETPNDPLKPHILEEEAFKAAYKAGNSDYNDHIAAKAREKHSIKAKVKRAVSKVRNKAKNEDHEEELEFSSDEVDELAGKIRHSQSGNHLQIVESDSPSKILDNTDKQATSHDSSSEEKVHDDEVKSLNAENTNPIDSLDSNLKNDESNKKDRDNELQSKHNCSSGSKKNSHNNSFEKNKNQQTTSQNFTATKSETDTSDFYKAKNNKAFPSVNTQAQKTKANHSNDSAYPSQLSHALKTTDSSRIGFSNPDDHRSHPHDPKIQNDGLASTSSSGIAANIVKGISFAGTTVYDALFGSTSNNSSESLHSSNTLSPGYRVTSSSVIEGPSGTTFCEKLPEDIATTNKLFSEQLNSISQVDEKASIPTTKIKAPNFSKKPSTDQTDKKFSENDSSNDQLLVNDSLESRSKQNEPTKKNTSTSPKAPSMKRGTNIDSYNSNESNTQNLGFSTLNGSGPVKISNEAVGEVPGTIPEHFEDADSFSSKKTTSNKSEDEDFNSVKPPSDYSKHSSDQTNTTIPIIGQSSEFKTSHPSLNNKNLGSKHSILPTGSYGVSGVEDFESSYGEFSDRPRNKPLTSADLEKGKKIPHVDSSQRNSIHGLDPFFLHPKPKSKTGTTSERSTVLNNPSFSSEFMTRITNDPSLLMTINSDLKPGDSRIAGKAIFPLSKEQLAAMTEKKNKSASINSEEFNNYQIAPLSSRQAQTSFFEIPATTQPIEKAKSEEVTKSKFQQPLESSFSSNQGTSNFENQGNLPQVETEKGVAAVNDQGDQRVPRSGGMDDIFNFDASNAGNAGNSSHGSQKSTSSVSSKNSFAMIAELQGLAQQSYVSQK